MLRRMFEKRLKGYRAIGYARGEAPLGYEEQKDDPVVGWADDAAPDFEEMGKRVWDALVSVAPLRGRLR